MIYKLRPFGTVAPLTRGRRKPSQSHPQEHISLHSRYEEVPNVSIKSSGKLKVCRSWWHNRTIAKTDYWMSVFTKDMKDQLFRAIHGGLRWRSDHTWWQMNAEIHKILKRFTYIFLLWTCDMLTFQCVEMHASPIPVTLILLNSFMDHVVLLL